MRVSRPDQKGPHRRDRHFRDGGSGAGVLADPLGVLARPADSSPSEAG